MAKPKQKIKIEWSENFAYAIGLIVTDGCLSKSGRHVEFTSKDLDQVENFLFALNIKSRITLKTRAKEKEKKYFRVQIGDVCFYRFLESIGLMQKKTLIMGQITIPREFFADFLRGHFDGDGYFYSYMDPRWKSSHMFYLVFTSASQDHLKWLNQMILDYYEIQGTISFSRRCGLLKYSKKKAEKLILIFYKDPKSLCLTRKRLKVSAGLSILQAR